MKFLKFKFCFKKIQRLQYQMASAAQRAKFEARWDVPPRAPAPFGPWPALQQAVSREETKMANFRRPSGFPLHKAARQGFTELVDSLIENGADVESKGEDGTTALHSAANGAVALLLLQRGADVSSTDANGLTALHWAALRLKPDVVQVLIEHRANADAKDQAGGIPWDWVNLNSTQDSTPHAHLQAVSVLNMLNAEKKNATLKSVAFAMGHHERLGAGSLVERLEPDVVRMVLELV